jgi:hypothetical protein
MRVVRQLLLTALAYLLVLSILAVATFFAVLVFAGPHSDVLPGWMEPVVLILGWLVVLVVPAGAAAWVWRRLGRGAQLSD